MTGLALKGIDGILLEGGSTLAASAFEAGIVDKVRLYMAPMVIGGAGAPGLIGGIGASAVKDAVRLRDISTERSGRDLVIEAYVDHGEKDRAEQRIEKLEKELEKKPDVDFMEVKES